MTLSPFLSENVQAGGRSIGILGEAFLCDTVYRHATSRATGVAALDMGIFSGRNPSQIYPVPQGSV